MEEGGRGEKEARAGQAILALKWAKMIPFLAKNGQIWDMVMSALTSFWPQKLIRAETGESGFLAILRTT